MPDTPTALENLGGNSAHNGHQPNSEQVDRIARSIQGSLKPVRPLPSDLLMVLIGLGISLAFSITAALTVGLEGFHNLTPAQRLAYYAVITACAISFSALIMGEMIPDSKRRVKSPLRSVSK